jgi:Arc/MetJ-type ribon-helix-helix transcriptional regulator
MTGTAKATVFPAVMLDERGDPTWSVQVELPPDIDAEIRRYVDQDELASWTVVIHEALCTYRTVFWTQEQLDAELREAIEEGIRSGETEWLH